ncbi:MAG: phycocyanobilin:ferredoxin oxidoreductase [Oscillatoriales cyanobacterium SM2_2_1]|nr:phycocyanobilin:ferredoxin oxidoreductase [Oscillatoriales cyanobacterium SM2_2_1]
MELHPAIARLAATLTNRWQQHLELTPFTMPEDLGYVEGKLEGDRVTIANTCYQARQFRKIHLELAQVGEHLDILHCVMFPHPAYPLPIFGTDLVGGKAGINAAIVDLSPMAPFSEPWDRDLKELQPLRDGFSQHREIPAWGDIFSPYCLFVRLTNSAEEQLFIDLAAHYATLVSQWAQTLAPLADPAPVLASQQRYCQQQQRNDKTRRVLEKAFGAPWAERYMTTVLFDVSNGK